MREQRLESYHFDGHGINAANGNRIATMAHGGTIPMSCSDGRRNPEFDRVGTLLAAAPELLEALQFVLFHIEHRQGLAHRMDLFSSDERDKMRAAIAKATQP